MGEDVLLREASKIHVIIGAALIAALSGYADALHAADARPADCELTVRGKTYIKGVCQFEPMRGGDFKISSNDYFAYVSITGRGVAEASWNEDPAANHAHSKLGVLTRKGACWVGSNATICARDLPPEKAKAIVATQPGGVTLWPNIPGASSACIGIEGKLEAGRALVLHKCRIPSDLIFVRGRDGTLGIDKRPDLCLAVESAGTSKPPRLIVDTCRADQARWHTDATDTKDGMVRSTNGRCLTIPQIDDPNARFPFIVTAAPCAGGAGKVTFHLSRG